jgi:hypothetical protein
MVRGTTVAAVLVCAAPTMGIIKFDVSIYKLFGSSAQVVIGKVTAVDAAKGEVRATVTDTMAPRTGAVSRLEGAFGVVIEKPAEVAKRVAVGQPIVIFVGRRGGSAVHVADEWLLAEQANATTWRTTGALDMTTAFPGRTAALVRVLEAVRKNPTPPDGFVSLSPAELAKIGNPLWDHFEHSNWGNRYDLGSLGVKPAFLVAADVNGDGKCDLLALAADGAHFYLGTGPKLPFRDATAAWGLAGAKGAQAAFGDVNGDGKPDLLLDELWLNTGTKFERSKAGINLSGKDVLAVTLADVTGDAKADAVALLKDGQLLAFENPGVSGGPWKARAPKALWTGGEPALAAHFGDWGDNGRPHVMIIRSSEVTRYSVDDDGPPAGIFRLTGLTLENLAKQGFSKTYFPIQAFRCSAVIDLLGSDGRPDLIIKKGGRDIVLLNRGYGAYWFNNEGSISGGKGGGPLPAALTAADMYNDGSQELLFTDGDGKLYQLNSPPWKKGKVDGE